MATTARSMQPQVGDEFDSITISLNKQVIEDYVNATGDASFASHAASIKLGTGLDIAPPTVFDRDMGSRLHQNRYPRSSMSLHAKQEFHLCKPLLRDIEYTISGSVTDVYEKNGADYFTFVSECRSPDGELAMTATKTSAFRFPGGSYSPRSERPKPVLRDFLSESNADLESDFPGVGSVIVGAPLMFTRGLMHLYSGPQSGHHSDARVAQLKGHKDSIVQGLSVTALEAKMYREIGGPRWYESGRIAVSYIKPVVADSLLTAVGVVSEYGDRITFKSAVFDQHAELVTIGSVSLAASAG